MNVAGAAAHVSAVRMNVANAAACLSVAQRSLVKLVVLQKPLAVVTEKAKASFVHSTSG